VPENRDASSTLTTAMVITAILVDRFSRRRVGGARPVGGPVVRVGRAGATRPGMRC